MRQFILLLSLSFSLGAAAQDALPYQTPPAAIQELALAAPAPVVSFDSKGKTMLIMERSAYPGIRELSQPELRLAGMRINPANFGPSRDISYVRLLLQEMGKKEALPLNGLPAGGRIDNITWSPDDKQIAFTVSTDSAITAWKADIATRTARQVSPRRLNSIAGNPLQWLDESRLLVLAVPSGISPAPQKPLAPEGPTVQQTKGKAAPAPTFQDLLKNPYDEKLFDHYFQSEPVITGPAGEQTIGSAGIYMTFQLSPDKQYLLVRKLHRPYSYLVTAMRFPATVEVWQIDGRQVKVLADNPEEIRPAGYDAAVSTPRGYGWRTDAPATVYWVQALDGGDPKRKVAFRDEIKMLAAPFTGEPVALVQTAMRYRGIEWGSPQLALVEEGSDDLQQVKISRVAPGMPAQQPAVVIERSETDRYNDPGEPLKVKNAYGRDVLYISPGNELLMLSEGASPEGDMPLLSAFNLQTGKRNILWRCEAPYYEQIVKVTDPVKLTVITSRESAEEPANYFLRDIKKKKALQLTSFPHPQPLMAGVQKQQLKYKRKDGVDLTAMLYLPKGYDPAKNGRLPVLIWAYPREYRSASDAAQVRGSRYRFTRVNYGSPIFWVTQGYAIMDAAEMPIVGEGSQQPNDNFVDQLTMNAEAAVGKITEMSIGDKDRIAVGGHSYGAFMTANLLAHTTLFKAGIARSGAYNRTLTPFGFQNEQRTYWQAPEVYYKMSPFSFANKIKAPILLIHGEADNNTGTFPIQSERLYNAIKGNGGTARLVFLPHESHGYAAKENILHMLWEMDQWLERYVKGK